MKTELVPAKATACWTSYTTGEYHHKIKIRYQCSQEGPLHQKGGHITHCSHNCDHSQQHSNCWPHSQAPPSFLSLAKAYAHRRAWERGYKNAWLLSAWLKYTKNAIYFEDNCVVVWHTRQPKKAGHNSHNHNLTTI